MLSSCPVLGRTFFTTFNVNILLYVIYIKIR